MECFFQLINISSIKELLHKFLGVHPLSYYPPKSRKHKKLLFFVVRWGPGNQCGISCFFMILWISESFFSLYLLVKNSFNFRFFHLFSIYFRGYYQKKTFYVQITKVPGDTEAKKTKKTCKLHIKFFPNVSLWIVHCYEHLWFKTFV